MYLRFYYRARVFIQIFLFVSLVCILSGCTDHKKISPRAQKGVIDLSSWDFKKDGTISLSGEWQFYWQQLLAPEDFASGNQPGPTGYSRLPGSWNNQVIDGHPLSGDGFATYRLQALVPQDKIVKAVRIKRDIVLRTLWTLLDC